MNIQMSKHASERRQQRCIPPLILEWLCCYGKASHDHHGAEVFFFDKQSRKALAKDVGATVVSRMESFLDTYAVISSDGTVITVGHRAKRVGGH
jgi:hypothetical protein